MTFCVFMSCCARYFDLWLVLWRCRDICCGTFIAYVSTFRRQFAKYALLIVGYIRLSITTSIPSKVLAVN